MKTIVNSLLLIGGTLAIGFLYYLIVTKQFPVDSDKTAPTPTVQIKPSPTVEVTPADPQAFSIFLIALNDNGKSGILIGCNDSVVAVDRRVVAGQADLKTALQDLLDLKSKTYGDAEVYNALYRSTLEIESINMQGDKVIIKLTGHYQIGGVCDAPRVEAQLEKTIEQFAKNKKIEIYINDKLLTELNSQK